MKQLLLEVKAFLWPNDDVTFIGDFCSLLTQRFYIKLAEHSRIIRTQVYVEDFAGLKLKLVLNCLSD